MLISTPRSSAPGSFCSLIFSFFFSVGESRGKGEFLAVRFLVPAEASRKAGRVQRGDRPTRGRDRSPPSARPCALARGGCDADVRRSPTCMCARFFWSWRKKKKEQSHTSRCARQLHLPGLLLYHDARRSKWGGGGSRRGYIWLSELSCDFWDENIVRRLFSDALMPERNRSTDLEASRPNCHFYLFPFASRRGGTPGSAAIYTCGDGDGRTSANRTGDKARSGWSVANWSCVSWLRSRFRVWCAVGHAPLPLDLSGTEENGKLKCWIHGEDRMEDLIAQDFTDIGSE